MILYTVLRPLVDPCVAPKIAPPCFNKSPLGTDPAFPPANWWSGVSVHVPPGGAGATRWKKLPLPVVPPWEAVPKKPPFPSGIRPDCGSPPSVPPLKECRTVSFHFPPACAGGVNRKTTPCPNWPPWNVTPYKEPSQASRLPTG